MVKTFDIIVIGAGHAGNEAAAAAAKMGSQVLLITMDMTKIGQMSCNPAMGGIGKGQIVREIDALGGLSGKITDFSTIQFKMLNRSKGPAMWSPRAQNDRYEFGKIWRRELENLPNLSFWQDSVKSLILKNKKVCGVNTVLGVEFFARSVILTAGTFLNGKIYVGSSTAEGGRIGEKFSTGITEQLISFKIETGRMKTGTPPRIDGRSVDFSSLERQPGDLYPEKFSFWPDTSPVQNQLDCFLTYTNSNVHQILEEGFDDSPIFTGKITGLGPRYCPSIEDKIFRFKEKSQHQLFLEPEGRNTVEYYLNGFSSSLPLHIQEKALQKIPGLENAKIFRPGYAIEYDFFQPTQLYPTLESKYIDGLFFAGQVNGTTGYEEAAGQGLIAGINAHQKIHNLEPVVLQRNQAYIGVLIDDLVFKGTEEPYRMFTSRAEYRITLRHNNADERLTPLGYKLGLIDANKYNFFCEKYNRLRDYLTFLQNHSIEPNFFNSFLESKKTTTINQKQKISNIISRPQISLSDILEFFPDVREKTEKIIGPFLTIPSDAECILKYSGYLEREKMMADKLSRLDLIKIPGNLNFQKISSLSAEAKEKLTKYKPTTLGEANKISGVSPADISILMVQLGR